MFIVSAVWNWLVEIKIEIWSRLYYIDMYNDDGTAVLPEIWSRLYYIDMYDDDGTAVLPEMSSDSVERDLRDKYSSLE